jgi:hypothetical protein
LDDLPLLNFLQHLVLLGISPPFVGILVSQPESHLQIVFDVFIVLFFIREKKGNNLFEKFELGLHEQNLCFVTLDKVG